MNLAKEMKKKRDAEKRLEQNSPMPIFVGGGSGGGNIENNTYISNEKIIQNFNEVNNTFNEVNTEITNIYTAINNIGSNRDLLTNGEINNTELLFANGDVIWVEV